MHSCRRKLLTHKTGQSRAREVMENDRRGGVDDGRSGRRKVGRAKTKGNKTQMDKLGKRYIVMKRP